VCDLGVQEARAYAAVGGMRSTSASATCGGGREICGSRGVHVVSGWAVGLGDRDAG
jgi:hypothetical protein